MPIHGGVFQKMTGYDEPAVRAAFKNAVDLHTLVISCLDPRTTEVPAMIAREFGDTYPGEVIRDTSGNKVASTTNVFCVTNPGGRAIGELRSITTLSHVFGLRNVVVVHHTFCGVTSFTPDGLIGAWEREHHADISHIHANEDLSIDDFERSLKHDVALIRNAPGTPRHINIYGYLFDINAETLTRIVEDIGYAPDAAMPVLARAA